MSAQALFDFIKSSPSAYHTVESVRSALLASGFTELYEADAWSLAPLGKYFVIRNGTSIIAFVNIPDAQGYTIFASHSDSPAFRVKPDGESVGAYISLPVERYGGSILYTWLDRPLSVAGRVIIRVSGGISSRLVNLDTDTMTIPSLAIHMNRSVNDGYKFNPAKDMIPLVSSLGGKGGLMKRIAKLAGCDESDIIAHDLFLYNRDEGRLVGLDGEFALCPRLDDLACVYSTLTGFLAAQPKKNVPVLAVFDNEEVGNETKQGAKSTLLPSVLGRISASENEHYRRLASSFMVSADNAHAKHPNFPELSDPKNAPIMGEGIAVKYNANQRYATDSISDAIFREICRGASVKLQSYTNRADMPGGSTLGSDADTLVSVPTVDIGIPQLAMHSANETLAVSDVEALVAAAEAVYSTDISFSRERISLS